MDDSNTPQTYLVTVEYEVCAASEEDARSTNFWCYELDDDGLIVGVARAADST